ncbi:MAG: hypothetical protein ACFFD2_20065 [Promethearchaeota archaeon]
MANKAEWTPRGKKVAKFLSYGIIISLVIVIIGSLWSCIDVILDLSESSTDFLTWFLEQYWTYQVLIIGGLIIVIFIGIIGFSIFIRKGQRFIYKHIFKLEPE